MTEPPEFLHGITFRRRLQDALSSALSSVTTAQFCLAPLVKTSPANWREFWRALERAPEKGALCRIVLAAPGPRNPQSKASMLAAPALTARGWQVRYSHSGRLLHAKTWVIDRSITIAGSHNLTEAALTRNCEASLLTRDPHTAEDATRWLEILWNAGTTHG